MVTNGYEIIDKIIASTTRNDPISNEDVYWWMSQIRKGVTRLRTDLSQSLKDTARDHSNNIIIKSKQTLTETARDLMITNIDKLNKTATAECNKLIGKSAEVLRKADSTRLALIQARRLANDMLSSLDSHVAQSTSRFDDLRDDLVELRDRIGESDFIPRAALASALASTEQDFVPMSQMDAILLRREQLENTVSDLRATRVREQPLSPK